MTLSVTDIFISESSEHCRAVVDSCESQVVTFLIRRVQRTKTIKWLSDTVDYSWPNALKYHGPSTSWRFALVLYLFFQIEVSKNAWGGLSWRTRQWKDINEERMKRMRIVGSGDKEIWWVRGYNGRVGQDGMGIGQLGRALGSRREGRGPSLRVLSLPFHSCPSIPLCPGSRFRFCYGFQSQTVNYFTSTEPCFSNTSIFPRPAPCLCLMPLRVSRE